MRVVVTGATGFIGRHVLDALRGSDAYVVAMVRSAASEGGVNADEVVVQDLHQADLRTYASFGCPDALILLAWGGLPNYRSRHHFEDELPAQYRFLRHLISSGLPVLMVSGTCFEYGMQSGALSESNMPLPDNPYGFAKNALRVQLEFLKLSEAFCLNWARLFYTYGAGQSRQSLLCQLATAVESGAARFDRSGGEQLRDYLPVECIASRLVALTLARCDAGIVNIASGRPVSVRGG